MHFRPTMLALVTAILGVLAFGAAPASAANNSSNNKPDLTVNIIAPTGITLETPGQYQVVVSNIGNRPADGVRLTIALPPTHTSPTVYVLGVLSAWDSPCLRSETNLTCSLGTIAQSGFVTKRFTIALPQSSAPLVVGASVTTSTPERSTTNNSDTDVAALLHPATPVVVGKIAHNTHCTGIELTSYYECTLFPSSIASHDIQFLASGVIDFVPARAGYTGTWSQALGTDRLVLEYFDTGSLVARFNGYAVDASCWEGLTNFFPTSTYVSAYRVCMQP